MVTTIQLDDNIKRKLDNLKIHKRESYNELIARMIESSNPKNFDKESLIETIEILCDPETMKNLKEALSEKESISWEKIKSKNKLNV